MDAKPCKVSAKSPQTLAPLPILSRFRSFPEMWCGLRPQLARSCSFTALHVSSCRLAALGCFAFLNCCLPQKK